MWSIIACFDPLNTYVFKSENMVKTRLFAVFQTLEYIRPLYSGRMATNRRTTESMHQPMPAHV